LEVKMISDHYYRMVTGARYNFAHLIYNRI
jgi:hypothetical protein